MPSVGDFDLSKPITAILSAIAGALTMSGDDNVVASKEISVAKPEYHAKKHGSDFGINPNPNDPNDKTWVAKYVAAAQVALQEAQNNGADYVIRFKHFSEEQIAYVKDGAMVIGRVVDGQVERIMDYFKPTETLYDIFSAANKSDVQVLQGNVQIPLSQLPGGAP